MDGLWLVCKNSHALGFNKQPRTLEEILEKPEMRWGPRFRPGVSTFLESKDFQIDFQTLSVKLKVCWVLLSKLSQGIKCSQIENVLFQTFGAALKDVLRW